MSGRMGHVKHTTSNLTIQAVDAERGYILVRGAVPGPRGSIVFVRSAAKGPDMAAVDIRTQPAAPTVTLNCRPRSSTSRRTCRSSTRWWWPSLAAARQGTHDTKSRGEVRGGGEAVQAEGHRSRPARLDPGAAVRRRRCGARPHAALVRPADAQEDEGCRAARGAQRPGPQRAGPRGEHLRRGHLAVDQGSWRCGARADRPWPRAGRGGALGRGQLALAAQPGRCPRDRAAAVQRLRRAGERRRGVHHRCAGRVPRPGLKLEEQA